MRNNILEVKNISKSYDSLKVLDNISFNVKKGEIVCIIGTSGCGKSTLLNIISGLDKNYKGFINTTLKENEYGYMFQEPSLFPWLTVKDNAALTCKLKNINNDSYVEKLLKKYLLSEFKDKYPDSISGGMKQRLALIRTISAKPKLLFLDEPFGALDYQTRISISNDIYNLIKENNMSAILVTHDISEAVSMADKVIVLSKRPSTIKSIVDIDFDNNTGPIERRKRTSFIDYYNDICKDLDIFET